MSRSNLFAFICPLDKTSITPGIPLGGRISSGIYDRFNQMAKKWLKFRRRNLTQLIPTSNNFLQNQAKFGLTMLFAFVDVLQNVIQLTEYAVFPSSSDQHKDNGQATY